MTALECPECGKPYDGENALANHLHKRPDHGPETWAEATDAAAGAESVVDSLTDGDDPDGADGGDGADPDGSDGDDGDTDPTVSEPTGPKDADKTECPKCGGTNLFDPTEYYPQYRYGCRDCSDSDTWEVFG